MRGAPVVQGAELVPDVGQMHVQTAVVATQGLAQSFLVQGFAADGLTGLAEQDAQDAELGPGQSHALILDRGHAFVRPHAQIAGGEDLGADQAAATVRRRMARMRATNLVESRVWEHSRPRPVPGRGCGPCRRPWPSVRAPG